MKLFHDIFFIFVLFRIHFIFFSLISPWFTLSSQLWLLISLRHLLFLHLSSGQQHNSFVYFGQQHSSFVYFIAPWSPSFTPGLPVWLDDPVWLALLHYPTAPPRTRSQFIPPSQTSKGCLWIFHIPIQFSPNPVPILDLAPRLRAACLSQMRAVSTRRRIFTSDKKVAARAAVRPRAPASSRTLKVTVKVGSTALARYHGDKRPPIVKISWPRRSYV